MYPCLTDTVCELQHDQTLVQTKCENSHTFHSSHFKHSSTEKLSNKLSILPYSYAMYILLMKLVKLL